MSSASPASSHGNAAGGGNQSPHQEMLMNFCRARNARSPSFQILSDRRGGRTAWSCVVTVQNIQYPARFWYDGQYVNNAREDAAEKALQSLGVLQAPQAQQPVHMRQQHPAQYYGTING